MLATGEDQRWMQAAISLSLRGRGLTAPNPNVGCVIVKDGKVIGRGVTAAGGRPHAEAQALEMAGAQAQGSTVYTTLEPCAHQSSRGPSCTNLLLAAKPQRVVVGARDPDTRTNGKGILRLKEAAINVSVGVGEQDAIAAMAGFFTRQRFGRPHVTLKFATSLDGCIARADGESQWITGPAARAHAHIERAQTDLMVVGRGTFEADQPRLDVRLPGLEHRSPMRALLTASGEAPKGWVVLDRPGAIAGLHNIDQIIVEGGAGAAAAFLAEDLVDRLVIYRAPIVIGGGLPSISDIGLMGLGMAHGRWQHVDRRNFACDMLDVFDRTR